MTTAKFTAFATTWLWLISCLFSHPVHSSNIYQTPPVASEFIKRDLLNGADFYIDHLPGLSPDDKASFPIMHSGQVEIDEAAQGNLFFWHVASKYRPESSESGSESVDRTIIWLNGGPGCSSMDGALMEIGPYRVSEGGQLKVNNGSWHEYANLLFIDQPFGVGFSFGDKGGYAHELPDAANDLVLFLDRFCEMFPETLRHDIYLAGESYAGQYLPYFAQAILNRNSEPKKAENKDLPSYNLKGVMIGNGWIDPTNQYLGYYPFVMQNGLVQRGSDTDKQLFALHEACSVSMASYATENRITPIHDATCEKLVQAILAIPPKEFVDSKQPENKCMNVYDIRLTDYFPSCGMNWPQDLPAVNDYLHDEAVLKALHVDNANTKPWQECASDVSRAFTPTTAPSIDLLPEILTQVPVLLFNGDQDFVCNHVGNEMMIDRMEWNGQVGWGEDLDMTADNYGRKIDWNLDDGTKAGWTKRSRNLTYTLFHNASHMVPFDLPLLTRAMLNGFMGMSNELNYITPSSPPFSSSSEVPAPNVSSSSVPEEHAKIIADATRKAYYKAGSLALVVVILVVLVLVLFIYKQRRRQEQEQQETGGSYNSLYMGLGNSSTAALTSISGIFKSVIGGISRWKETPSNLARRARKKVVRFAELNDDGNNNGGAGGRWSRVDTEEDVGMLEQGVYYDLDNTTADDNELDEFNIESDGDDDNDDDDDGHSRGHLVDTSDQPEMIIRKPL